MSEPLLCVHSNMCMPGNKLLEAEMITQISDGGSLDDEPKQQLVTVPDRSDRLPKDKSFYFPRHLCRCQSLICTSSAMGKVLASFIIIVLTMMSIAGPFGNTPADRIAMGTAQHNILGRRLSRTTNTETHKKKAPRLLYIVTTLAEYNSGTRATVRGSDRLQETLIPVVSEGIRSMLAAGYHVDLFLVCHFTLTPERRELVEAALPRSVGLQVWNDATPLGYDTAKESLTKLQNRTLH